MFQIFEDCIRSFCIRCEDVGLDCNCIIYGNTAEKVVDETFMHMFEYHAKSEWNDHVYEIED